MQVLNYPQVEDIRHSNRYIKGSRYLRYNTPNILYFKSIYSVIIALLPVIEAYNTPFVNKGLSTVLLGLTIPYVCIVIICQHTFKGVFPVSLLLVYMMARSSNNSSNEFLLTILLFHILGALSGSLELKAIRSTLETISIIATLGVIFQTILYYIFHINLSLVISTLLLDSQKMHLGTGIGSGMYRPSSIFLEPAHMAQYCSLGIISCLFPARGSTCNYIKAIFIMIGILLTTSGMGIAISFCIMGWFFIFKNRDNKLAIIRLIQFLILASICFALLMQVSIFQKAVERIFTDDANGGIKGRTMYWDSNIGSMEGIDKLIGYGTLDVPSNYMTGLMYIIYCYGYMGVVLYILLHLYFIIRARDNYTIIQCILICVLQTISYQMNFLSLSFRTCLIICSMLQAEKNRSNFTLECVNIRNNF